MTQGASSEIAGLSSKDSRWQRLAPIVTLIFLAPFVAEVLSGATRLSFIFVLIPEMMVWGCGTLLIRDIVRRWQGGWTSMLCLGLALAVAEEFIIQQTSLAPLAWLPSPAYGRAFGINLVYFLFMLGFESVWVVLVPVQLTELIFPDRREKPWLKKSGLIVSSFVFLAGSFFAWFLWTQIARPKTFHVPKYQPPFFLILLGILLIITLALVAYALRHVGQNASSREMSNSSQSIPTKRPLSPWVVGLVPLFFGFPWYLLMTLIFGPRRNIPIAIPLLVGLLWAAFAYFVIQRCAASSQWTDIHSWVLVSSTMLVSMLAGFGGSDSWSRADYYGKVVLNLLAVLGLILLLVKIIHRSKQQPGT